MKRYLLAVLAAGVWMNVSEFGRNELVIKDVWVDGFAKMGLSFPAAPVNGALWGLWVFIFAAVLAVLIANKFGVLKSVLISWITGFVLLWLAMWNMGVMPDGLLYWAVPWSFVEVYVAALICHGILRKERK